MFINPNEDIDERMRKLRQANSKLQRRQLTGSEAEEQEEQQEDGDVDDDDDEAFEAGGRGNRIHIPLDILREVSAMHKQHCRVSGDWTCAIADTQCDAGCDAMLGGHGLHNQQAGSRGSMLLHQDAFGKHKGAHVLLPPVPHATMLRLDHLVQTSP
jgi:hypothetical protein